MLDEVRSSDWAPRSVYRKQRQLSAAIHAVENRKGQHATARDIAEELGVSIDEYHKLLSATSHAKMFSLEQAAPDGEGVARTDAARQHDPVHALETEEFHQQMVQAIRSLPEREALVMSLYYDDELNLKEIGKVLGVSESRICQIHGQALARLRARLQEWTADVPETG